MSYALIAHLLIAQNLIKVRVTVFRARISTLSKVTCDSGSAAILRRQRRPPLLCNVQLPCLPACLPACRTTALTTAQLKPLCRYVSELHYIPAAFAAARARWRVLPGNKSTLIDARFRSAERVVGHTFVAKRRPLGFLESILSRTLVRPRNENWEYFIFG